MLRIQLLKKTVFLLFIGLLIILITACNGFVNNNVDSTIPVQQTQSSIVSTQVVNQEALARYLSGESIKIHEIQGKDHESLFVRKKIEFLTGVVTVKRGDGFYIQSLEPDDDDLTSEGIFVFLNKPPKVDIGDLVFVDGHVTEFFPGGPETGNLSITQIENAYYSIISKNNSLPQPIILGEGGRILPTTIIEDDGKQKFEMTDGLDFYESLEGMLVQINDAVVVGATTAHKEITVLSDFGKNATGMNERGGITINAKDFNPERIILDDSLASLPEVKVGELFEEPIIGIVDYSFGNFKIQVLKRIKGNQEGVAKETATLQKENELTVVSYNVENLSAKDSDKRFELLADQIVNLLKSPDILALQEIQDDDGSTNTNNSSAESTYQKIINAVTLIGGPEYHFVDIAPVPNKDGGEPGANIRPGFLYRIDTGLELVPRLPGGAEEAVKVFIEGDSIGLNFNPGRIDPLNYAFFDSRKPLVAEFLYNGNKLLIVNNHWNSKGGDNPLFGSIQPPRLNSEVQRNNQSEVVKNFIADIITMDENARIMVVGDLNDFYFSAPIRNLEEADMINLMYRLDTNERYTYIYDGNSQVLDNMLVSASLNEIISEFDILHINSEFPYRERFSDHDPVLVRFEFLRE